MLDSVEQISATIQLLVLEQEELETIVAAEQRDPMFSTLIAKFEDDGFEREGNG